MDRHVIGMQIGATTDPTDLRDAVVEAEQLGYGEVWLAEVYFELGGIAEAALALGATAEIPIGLGVVAAPARHPAVTAMEFATLGRAFPGRFLAGLGHGAPGWVRQMGLWPASPVGLLREATAAIRELLDGGEVDRAGDHFSFERVRLSHPPVEPTPIYLGVQGSTSLRLSGELADGTLLGWFSSPSYVAWARARIDEGRERAGRSDPHELVVLCVLSISDDEPVVAQDDIGGWATRSLAAMSEMPQVTLSPVRAELLAAIDEVTAAESHRSLPADLLREFAAVGDTARCRATIEALFAAGADRVVLVPNPAGVRSTEAMLGQMRSATTLLAEPSSA